VNVVAVSGENGEVADAQLLAAAERVHLQLRPHLAGNYVPRMREVIAAGAEMAVAHVGGDVLGVAVYRMVERTFSGREMYCDDLVTDAGVGLRLDLPIGPLRIDYGIPIEKGPYKDAGSGKFNFNVGYQF